jgi:CheY-like chemotaxis protein
MSAGQVRRADVNPAITKICLNCRNIERNSPAMRWGSGLTRPLGNRNFKGRDMQTRRTSVLVVEDEVLISNLVSEVLNEHGFKVHTVAAGEEALKYLESGADVDVLFTDIDLLGRMDGSMRAREARAQRPELPIVYCSGRYSPSALAPPVSRSIFVRKPYSPEDLCRLFERLTAGTTH